MNTAIALAVVISLVSIPRCSAIRPDCGLAFSRMWNSTPRDTGLPMQKSRIGSQRKPSLAHVSCQQEGKAWNAPTVLNKAKSSILGACKQVPTVKGAVAAASLVTLWYMYPSLAAAADASSVVAGKLAAVASAPVMQFANFLPAGRPRFPFSFFLQDPS